jgi:carboxymethylenebutenolidase
MDRIALFGLVMMVLAACSRGGEREATVRDTTAAHLDAMAREHAGQTPTPNASAREPTQPVTAEEVVYGTLDGQPLHGYLARPAAAVDSLPGLLVIHEWWGLNDNIRMMTRRLAGEGYIALAVDLYGGQVASNANSARELVTTAMRDPERGMRNLAEAAGYLEREHGVHRLGTIGWCFGGGWSLAAGIELPEQVDAVVMYYGQPVTDPARLRPLRAPVLGLFGGADQGIPVDTVRKMEQEMKALGKEATIHVYPGAGHAFANPSGPTYNERDAEDAWQRTMKFLHFTLQEPG